MKNAKTPEELVNRFVSKEDHADATKQIGEFLDEARQSIERDGQIYELKRMIDYHQYMADLSQTTDAEKHVHLADIVVLQQRIAFLEGKDKE